MSARMKERYDIGVVIGRFQVAKLHDAHINLLNEVKDNHEQMIIMLTVPGTLGTKRNPLPFPVRAEMMREKYPKSIITHLMDTDCDFEWSRTVDKTIRMLCPFGSVILYGGRDSFIPHYHGIYPTYELSIITETEGTTVRKKIGHTIKNSSEFREGIIFSCQNQYPRVNQTVDIAITKMSSGLHYVFLGRRKSGMGLRFPGGFVEPTDQSLEMATRREQIEEIDLESSTDLTYVGSHLQEDWRYNTPDERIMTVLFQSEFIYGTGRAKEEFSDTEWIEVKIANTGLIEDHHKILFQMLCTHMIGINEDYLMDEEPPVKTDEKKPHRVSNFPADQKLIRTAKKGVT